MELKSPTDAPGSVELYSLFDDLVRLETQLWNEVDDELRATHDLPLSWYEPMQVVRRIQDCRVADIAAALSITVGGTSKLVDRIGAAGLLAREPHPEDGRSSIIALTDAGRQALAAAERTFTEVLERRVRNVLPPRQLAELKDALRRLRRSLGAG